MVGRNVGAAKFCTGALIGDGAITGDLVGVVEGVEVGTVVGVAVGTVVGVAVGPLEGLTVGDRVGVAVGTFVGAAVGEVVGRLVGAFIGAGLVGVGTGTGGGDSIWTGGKGAVNETIPSLPWANLIGFFGWTIYDVNETVTLVLKQSAVAGIS